tara:strand:+ start:72 stop:476 length:405 start_codon:yes stop_codon:yes gene_type:complete
LDRLAHTVKKPLAILLIFSLLSPYLVSAQTDPCKDKEFLRLKDVNINDMTDREYEYFMLMNEKCAGDSEVIIVKETQPVEETSNPQEDNRSPEEKQKAYLETLFFQMVLAALLTWLIGELLGWYDIPEIEGVDY